MLKKLVQHVGEYKRPTFYTPLFVAGECALDIIIPLVIAMLIDRGIEKGDQQAILFYGAILLVCALLALVLGTLSGRFAAIASAGFAKNLRGAMFRKIQSYSFSNIDRFSTNLCISGKKHLSKVTNLNRTNF